jgi:aspartyl-tRNA(Asn)/glutamyl-tRNA(Gln) amidotransferase subunit A
MPTFGRVPKTGCVPLAYSLDRVGPLAHTALDCALVLDVLAGFEPGDPDSADRPVPDHAGALGGDLAGLRIGAARAHVPESADPEAVARFEDALAVLASLGADVVEVELPHHDHVVAATAVTRMAESFALHRDTLRSRWDDYSPTTRSILATGVFVTGADYVQAQRVRRVARRELRALQHDVPVIVMPTVAGPPDPLGARQPSDLAALFARLLTRYWNLLGNPALSVPMGFTAAGLPLGLQIAGRPFAEADVLRVGDAYQRRTDWHRRCPPGFGDEEERS